jgi:hypothetical protein
LSRVSRHHRCSELAERTRSLLLPCALALLFAVSAGCGRFRKAKECGLLADAVESWMKKDAAPSPAGADTPALVADARATAARYRELDRTLSEIKLASDELTPLVQRYRQMAIKSAEALEEVSRALLDADLERARKLRVDFDATVRAEAPLVEEINAACRK